MKLLRRQFQEKAFVRMKKAIFCHLPSVHYITHRFVPCQRFKTTQAVICKHKKRKSSVNALWLCQHPGGGIFTHSTRWLSEHNNHHRIVLDALTDGKDVDLEGKNVFSEEKSCHCFCKGFCVRHPRANLAGTWALVTDGKRRRNYGNLIHDAETKNLSWMLHRRGARSAA